MVLWDSSPASSRSAGFLNKISIPPCPNSSSLVLLACHVASSRSLDSVTAIMIRFRALQEAYLGLPWQSSGEEFALQCMDISSIPGPARSHMPWSSWTRCPRSRTHELHLHNPLKVTTDAYAPRTGAATREAAAMESPGTTTKSNSCWPQLESPPAATKAQHSQKVNK